MDANGAAMTSYRFRPGWITTLAALALFPVLAGLGVWQLDRAQEKIEIRDRYVSRGQMPPVDVNRNRLDPEAADFRRARVQGRYREAFTIYLDNKVLNGVPGYEVLTPLAIVDRMSESPERFILVNRGWVAWGESRETLPEIETPAGLLELSGRLRTPPEDYFTLESREDDETFTPLWQNLDLRRYQEATGLALTPLVLQLDPDAGGTGLVRQRPEHDDPWIQRHRAYAVQWFGLAFLLLVLYVVLNLEKKDRDERKDSE